MKLENALVRNMNVSVFIRHIFHEGEVPGAGGRSRSHARGTALADGTRIIAALPPDLPGGSREGTKGKAAWEPAVPRGERG